MNLNRIEIQGFKSFPDKTEIIFDTNITGIVGPNGCGKSNVVEAVRWVLGEQKNSSLRISKNVDLIFDGTKNRRSQSYCEVSIYLDNSLHLYPIEFEELVITRKLDRSGESTSLINGQKCNLKDVVNLFRDTGVGKEGYSIIGQGKIDNIMASQPEARREIFEEAAGITKHKFRKTASENKLVNTRDNMSRLNDIMKELESNLGPLKEEATQAAELKKLKSELKKEDVELFLFQSENIELTKSQTENKLKEITGIYSAKQLELSILNEDYNSTLNIIGEIDSSANSLHEKILQLTINAQKAIGKAENLTLSLEYKQEDISKKTSEYQNNLSIMQNRSADVIARINDKNSAEEKLIITKAEYEEVNKLFISTKESVEFQEKQLDISKQLLLDTVYKRAEIDKNRATYEVERNILSEKLIENSENLREKRKSLSEAQSLLKNYGSLETSLKSEKEHKMKEKLDSESNYISIKNELIEAEKNNVEFLSKKSNLEFKLATIKENIDSYGSYDSAVQELMEIAKNEESVKKKIIGTFAEILSVPKEYVVAIEIALGNALQNIVTPNESDASALIDILKTNNLGRATFLPITSVKPNPLANEYLACLKEPGVIGCAYDIIKYDRRFSAIVSSFLGRTIVVENKDYAINIAKKYNYGFRIVTLEGEAFLPSGAISGGSSKFKNSRILSQEAELLDVEKKLNKIIKDLALIVDLITELKDEKGKIELAFNVLDSRILYIDKELIDINSKKESIEEKCKLLTTEIDKALLIDQETNNRIIILDSMLSSTGKNSEDAKSEKISTDDYINDAKEKYFKLKESLDSLSSRLTELLVIINTTESQIKGFESDILGYRSQIKYYENRQIELDVAIKILNAEINTIQKNIDSSEFSEEDKQVLLKAKEELNTLDTKKAEKKSLLSSLEQARIEKNKQVIEIGEKKVREESNLEKINMEINNNAQRMLDTYGYDFNAAQNYWDSEGLILTPKGRYDIEKSLDKILRLRRKIDKMGPVNELAEEKYLQENSRYEEMVSQFEDLKKAEEDLMKIITDLTLEMETKFIESFKQINTNFNTTFNELFCGGYGKLSLDKGVSPLISGIYISAEPPGKSLKSIELLSGGEKTLTAIAILFAINKLSPMPFSILDEIDASLDETNARLFAQYLSKFSSETQFIVITHRKPTMSLCDVLYGVTMQEKGISKVVKVRLEEAEKQIKESEENK